MYHSVKCFFLTDSIIGIFYILKYSSKLTSFLRFINLFEGGGAGGERETPDRHCTDHGA